MAPTSDDITALREDIRDLRALVQGQTSSLPDQAAYTLREARIRISRRMDPRTLTETEVDDMLDDRRVMSASQLRKIRGDEANPIRVVALPAGKRILEQHIRQAEAQAERQSTPASWKQM